MLEDGSQGRFGKKMEAEASRDEVGFKDQGGIGFEAGGSWRRSHGWR